MLAFNLINWAIDAQFGEMQLSNIALKGKQMLF